MEIVDQLKAFLKSYKNKTLNLIQLQNSVKGSTTTEDFYAALDQLLAKQILRPIGKGKNPQGFALKYGIVYSKLFAELFEELKLLELKLHRQISLDYYYLHPNQWQKDKVYVEKINRHLEERPEIFQTLYLPELSLLLVDDEKWLEHKHGKKLLQNLKLWEILNPSDRYEPLAFGVNLALLKGKARESKVHKHLILENKTIFKLALEQMESSTYSSIIYGQGFKILSSIHMLKQQLKLAEPNLYYYFGDLDRSGIAIFSSLAELVELRPAPEFYHLLLSKEPLIGKAYQNCSQEKIDAFLGNFPLESQEKIMGILDQGMYLPQELISTADIQALFSEKAEKSLGEK